MRTSEFLLTTLKETPSDAELASHRLMLRAGLIRPVARGIYTWLPLGLIVLKKVMHIVRDEMDNIGAQELLMPTIQPAELWHKSGRWDAYGKELLTLEDRHQRQYCYGPTHEEVITHLLCHELRSYKQLPVCFYQIQSKFRDEIRPRFGVMRSREFYMKDAYSFHLDQASLQKTYDAMHAAYSRILTRLGLQFRAVIADSGSIGGDVSHEFQVLARAGEDRIALSDQSDYAANVELAEAIAPNAPRAQPAMTMQTVNTPDTRSIEAVCDQLKIPPTQTVKTLIVHGTQTPLVALCLRGDHLLNDIKAAQLPEVASPLQLASDDEIQKAIGCAAGYIGPVNLNLPIIADRTAAIMSDFVCGANANHTHLKGVNWQRDLAEPKVADLRQVVTGDPSPDGKGNLSIAYGIEVGHIFQNGEKYSRPMGLQVSDQQGKNIVPQTGCYGIGISRIVAAAIEQNHDEEGIIWPAPMAPFQVALIPINSKSSELVNQICERLYTDFCDAGLTVLYDDRDERPGVKFADVALIGIPHRVVVGERNLKEGEVEYKSRSSNRPHCQPENINVSRILEFIQEKIACEQTDLNS